MEEAMSLEELKELGFDKSYQDGDGTENRATLHLRCSQCESVFVNGIPIHEEGCPNEAKAKRDRQIREYMEDQDDEDSTTA
jgi:hypothetical protein